MESSTVKVATRVAGALVVLAVLGACSSSAKTSPSAATSATSVASAAASEVGGAAPAGNLEGKIGLLLPNTQAPRYEGADRPYFESKVKELCPNCTVLYANANADAAKQQQQAESMLSQGVKVLALDATDTQAAAGIVAEAKAKNVPVISYARLINSAGLAYFSSSDDDKVGGLQAQSLLDKLQSNGVKPGDGGILMINGDATDSAAVLFKTGAHKVIDSSGYQVLAEFDNWDPTKVQDWVASQVTRFGSKIKGIYSANDGNAGAAVAALKGAGVSVMPPITGLDSDVDALQRIVMGTQYMTVYSPIRPMADKAAEVAVSLIKGETPTGDTTVTTPSGASVPASLVEPVPVTAGNIETTIVKDGFHTVAEICTTVYADACAKAGLK